MQGEKEGGISTGEYKVRPRFVAIPYYTLERGLWAKISPKARALLGAICFYASRKQGKCWARAKKLAAQAGLSVESVRRAKLELKSHGIVDYTWVPYAGSGHYIWLALEEPHKFSDEAEKFRKGTIKAW